MFQSIISGLSTTDGLFRRPGFVNVTSTSELVFHSTGSDSDGNFVGLQYYVNGLPYGDEIMRPNYTNQTTVGYMKNWSPGQPGVYSIFAIGRDNSGNYVGTNVLTLQQPQEVQEQI